MQTEDSNAVADAVTKLLHVFVDAIASGVVAHQRGQGESGLGTKTERTRRRYLSLKDAAEYAGYTSAAMWKHIQRGNLPVSRQGRSLRVDIQEIDKWMEHNKE